MSGPIDDKIRSQINALNSIAWGMFFAIGQIIGGIIVDNKGFTPPLLLTATLYFLATLPFVKIKYLLFPRDFTYVPDSMESATSQSITSVFKVRLLPLFSTLEM